MSETDDAAEKEHEPTQKKLDDARTRGEVVKSAELAVAASYGALLLAAVVTGFDSIVAFGQRGAAMLGRAETLSTLMLDGGAAVSGSAIGAALLPMLPFLLAPFAAVVAVLFAQHAWVLAPEKVVPKWSRIDPLSNARQKFGRSGLFEFLKSAAKLLLVSLLLGLFLAIRLPRALMSQGLDPALAASELGRLIIEFLFLILLVSGALGVLDYLWQRHEHLRRNRMSRQELMDELKQTEGDPHMRGQRRRRAEEVAMNRMISDVPKADVIIVNPMHYAVALRWDRRSGRAPVCVAKGVDAVAARIREAAAAAGIPIRSDPPTARALHASVEIGQEVLPDHYAHVAAAIRFAERMRRRARERRGG
ncbi:Flagellar biosynthetic protein FlhB [Defluviimonas aquaemixtae]|uniref:Flagellar biosynthetic protein FlhB n=1 Tax=Albidovulum aquaemixtae TaxID=1542388 RepID=A0A2R8BJ87_9RHOB|nr:flagellar type III secretion system protein FlhB [Defluviimonas aquaemixtae]SPH23438.1 Flagellar biosynthetic protein FlhB [Defluviimonas aquaemixtae]